MSSNCSPVVSRFTKFIKLGHSQGVGSEIRALRTYWWLRTENTSIWSRRLPEPRQIRQLAKCTCYLTKALTAGGNSKMESASGSLAHGFVGQSLAVVACPSRVSGGDQGAAKIPVVLKTGERKGLRRVVGLEAIAGKQAGLEIIELVVVFSPVGRAVQPVAAMAFKIADAGEFELFEIIELVQRVLEIGIPANRTEGSIFVDFYTLGCNGPGHFAVESRGDLSAVPARELEERLERVRVVDEGRRAGR